MAVDRRKLRKVSLHHLSWDQIRAEARAIAAGRGVGITFNETAAGMPVRFAAATVEAIEATARALGYTTVQMPSGAGHDAQTIAPLAPSGMIFVPSVAGISHSPKELTRWEDCANGANILLQAVLAMDEV